MTIDNKALSLEQMWQAWPDAKDPKNLVGLDQAGMEKQLNSLSLSVEEGTTPERVTYDTPITPRALALQSALRTTKLAIYADIMAFYHQETNHKMFKKRWQELHGEQVQAADLDTRLKRANEGKDAANQRYTKEDNWFGALYTYALAWGCLLPYYPEALAPSNQHRLEMIKLEGAIFSNIAATIVTGSSSKVVEAAQKPGMIQLGLRAALVCMAMADNLTVGVVSKACQRSIKLRARLKTDQHQIPETEAGQWQAQLDKLDGVDAKLSFGNLGSNKKVIKPRITDLKVIPTVV